METAWKIPIALESVANPEKLKEWAKAAIDAEIPLDLLCVAQKDNFYLAYLELLNACESIGKFSEVAKHILGYDNPLSKVDENKNFFSGIQSYCDKCCSTCTTDPKKKAWANFKTHFGEWVVAFSSDNIKYLLLAIEVDNILSECEKISIPDAITKVSNELPNKSSYSNKEVTGAVSWYLKTIRDRYRKNIEIIVSKVKCETCNEEYDEGTECQNCKSIGGKLESAKSALKKGDLDNAEKYAKEVLNGGGNWSNNKEATEIITKVNEKRKEAQEKEQNRKQLEIKKNVLKSSIEELIKLGNYAEAKKKVGELKEFDVDVSSYLSTISEGEKAQQIKKFENDFNELIKGADSCIKQKEIENAKNKINAARKILNENKSAFSEEKYEKIIKNMEEKVSKVEKAEKEKKDKSDALRKKVNLSNWTLIGKGEGLSKSVVAKLRWSLKGEGLVEVPAHIQFCLSRKDGKIKDTNIKGENGIKGTDGELCYVFEDYNVEIGKEYEYSLRETFEYGENGELSIKIKIEKAQPPSPVKELKVTQQDEKKWQIEWDWPDKVDKACIVMSDGKDISSADVCKTQLSFVCKRYFVCKRAEHCVVTETSLPQETKKIFVFSVKSISDECLYSEEPESKSLIAKKDIIKCIIVPHGGLLRVFRRSPMHKVLLKTEAKKMPELVVIAGNERRPQYASDGEEVGRIMKNLDCNGEVSVDVPASYNPNYLNVFFANPSVDAENFKIAPISIK